MFALCTQEKQLEEYPANFIEGANECAKMVALHVHGQNPEYPDDASIEPHFLPMRRALRAGDKNGFCAKIALWNLENQTSTMTAAANAQVKNTKFQRNPDWRDYLLRLETHQNATTGKEEIIPVWKPGYEDYDPLSNARKELAGFRV